MSRLVSESRNPANGEVIGSFPLHGADDIPDMVARCRAVQPAWAALPWRKRSAVLARVGRTLALRADEVARLISRDNGKTPMDALAAEVLPAVLALSYYRRRGRNIFKSRRIGGGSVLMFNKRSRLHKVPWGVVGIISPWNYPFAIPFSEVVMALLAGNAVVLKVASDTLAVGQIIAELFEDAGLPDGLLAYVNLPGREAGPAFLSAGIDKLFFTGSTAVGKDLMRMAADRLTPLVLELGGNDAALVRGDADLDRAVSGIIWAGFANAGQSCGGVQRVYVHRGVWDDFKARLSRRMETLRVGPPDAPDTDVGAMCSARQKAAVDAQVRQALEAGARVAARTPLPPGLDPAVYMAPLALENVPDHTDLIRDEVFGPVLALIPVADDEEAMVLANASPYGLTASVWTRSRARARELAPRLNAGAVMVNDHLMSHGLAETPWGGNGDSGLGRTHGELGLLEMVKTRVVVTDILPGQKKAIWWHPYSAGLYRGIKALISFAAGPGILRRLQALPRVIGVFLRYWER